MDNSIKFKELQVVSEALKKRGRKVRNSFFSFPKWFFLGEEGRMG